MKSSEIIIPLVIYLALPLIGMAAFIWLCRKIKRQRIQEPPYVPLFVLFFNLGGMLTVILTALFWEWSGMAVLGCFYLVFLSPIVSGLMSWKLWHKRKLSKYHLRIFWINLCFGILMIMTALVWLVIFTFFHA